MHPVVSHRATCTYFGSATRGVDLQLRSACLGLDQTTQVLEMQALG